MLRLLLICGTKLLARCHLPSKHSWRLGWGENEWEGEVQAALPAASSGAWPLLFILMLTSPCAALRVTRDYKSYSNGRIIFIFLIQQPANSL